MERVADNGLRLHLIANSHGHIDHIFDNAPLMRASGTPLAIHPDDAYRLEGRNNYGFEIERSVATQDLREGEQLRIGDLVFDILHTPGHSEGSVCLYEERLGLMLSGDVLFAGSYGRTDLPGGNDEQMVASLARLARDIPAPRAGASRPRPRDDGRTRAAVAPAHRRVRQARRSRLRPRVRHRSCGYDRCCWR